MEGLYSADSQPEDSLKVDFEHSETEEGLGSYFEFAQPEESFIQGYDDDDLSLRESREGADEKNGTMVGQISGENNGESDEIVADTYEDDVNESLTEGVVGQEESSGVRDQEAFDLNQDPIVDVTPPLAPVVKEDRNFDLNKLPSPELEEDIDLNNSPAGDELQIEDGIGERTFILVFVVRLPGLN